MLKRVTTTTEPVRILLLSDPAVWQAQVKAARDEVDKELEVSESADLIDEVIRVVKATSGNHAEVVRVLSTLSDSARSMLGGLLSQDQNEKAQRRIKEALEVEDTREGIAFLRAHGAAALYRESSNVEDLLDASPDGASWVTLRALSRDEIRASETAAGPRPRLGAIISSQALDVARKAARKAEDSTVAYAEHIAALPAEKQIAVEDYDRWSERVDIEVFRRSVISIDGFEYDLNASGYPVDEFVAECVEAPEVISETARHARQVGRLGK